VPYHTLKLVGESWRVFLCVACEQEANVAFKVRAVVEGTLPETLQRIPIEKRFNKNYVREVCVGTIELPYGVA
jgi:hypothetical protein